MYTRLLLNNNVALVDDDWAHISIPYEHTEECLSCNTDIEISADAETSLHLEDLLYIIENMNLSPKNRRSIIKNLDITVDEIEEMLAEEIIES